MATERRAVAIEIPRGGAHHVDMGKAELRVEIDKLLLEQAEAAGLDLGSLTERALKEALGREAAEARAKRWAEENRAAIEAHRKEIDERGVFGEDLRTW